MRSAKPPLTALLVALLCCPDPMFACGPFFEIPVFTFAKGSFSASASRGKWEVIQPSYTHRELILAYRYLTGVGLRSTTAAEQQTHGSGWPPGVQDWLEARKKVPAAAPIQRIDVFREFKQYQYFHNCLEDAFLTAARTLNDRIQTFGAESAAVVSWLHAQDQVFRNCASGPATLPASDEPNLPALLRFDRAYQIAAANFYALNFQAAEAAFREIARDRSSPWRRLAAYLVARTLIRQATLSTDKPDPVILARAEEQLRNVLSDDDLSSLHNAARRLLSFVEIRLNPEEKLRELSRAVLAKDAGESFERDLTDYHYLFDRIRALNVKNPDDLSDWLLTFQAQGKDATDHAFERWRAASALPWLVASITKLTPEDPRAPELLRAAAAVKPDSPGFSSAAFHSIRLLMGSGESGEARKRLDALLSTKSTSLTVSARNLFLAQRMKLARNLNEFLRDAPRSVVGRTYVYLDEESALSDGPVAQRFDADAIAVVNEKLPLRLLRRAATSKVLPAQLRRDISVAAWVRAILLGQHETGRQLAPVVAELAPELKRDLSAYVSAQTEEARKFSAVFLILRSPGLKPFVEGGFGRKTPLKEIDNFRDNWWCAFHGKPALVLFDYYTLFVKPSLPLQQIYPEGTFGSPGFLTEAEEQEAAAEWKKLASLPTGPNYLSQAAVEWATAHPDDPRVPESLHLAVKSTRFGCTDADTGGFSRRAFALLHRKYPNSSWARQTKYWYQ